jgi:hypothetical protein
VTETPRPIGGCIKELVLTNSVLSNMVPHMISFFYFHLPKGFLQRVDYFRARFFWQEDNEKKNRLAKWSVVVVRRRRKGSKFMTFRLFGRYEYLKITMFLMKKESYLMQVIYQLFSFMFVHRAAAYLWRCFHA